MSYLLTVWGVLLWYQGFITIECTCREPLKHLSEADRKSRAKSLYSDYLSSPDIAEATASVEELSVPGKYLAAATAQLSCRLYTIHNQSCSHCSAQKLGRKSLSLGG